MGPSARRSALDTARSRFGTPSHAPRVPPHAARRSCNGLPSGKRHEPERHLIQPAALGLILLGLGAIQKKAMTWKTGFWGEKAGGWHYDLMLLAMNGVILTTAGGGLVIRL